MKVAITNEIAAARNAQGSWRGKSGDGSRAVRAVRRVLHSVAFPTMSEAGVREEHVERLTELTLTEQAFFFDYDCHDWSRDEVAGAFREALALTAR